MIRVHFYRSDGSVMRIGYYDSIEDCFCRISRYARERLLSFRLSDCSKVEFFECTVEDYYRAIGAICGDDNNDEKNA